VTILASPRCVRAAAALPAVRSGVAASEYYDRIIKMARYADQDTSRILLTVLGSTARSRFLDENILLFSSGRLRRIAMSVYEIGGHGTYTCTGARVPAGSNSYTRVRHPSTRVHVYSSTIAIVRYSTRVQSVKHGRDRCYWEELLLHADS
jgi:hypothetical protein